MNSIKCPGCGLVNFAATSECKRCHYEFPARQVAAVVVPANDETVLPAQNSDQAQPKPRREPLPEYEAIATPIGGWLIVFAIGLVISIAASVFYIQNFVEFISTEAFQDLTTPGSEIYVPNFTSGITVEFVWLSVLGISSLLLLFRFVRRSSSFPRLAVFVLAANIAFAFLDYLMGLNVQNQLMEKLTAIYGRGKVPDLLPSYVHLIVLYCIVSSGLWIAYMLTSRRVESTFIY